MKSLIAELKRRHVLRVALAYLVVAWLVIQIVGSLIALLDVPAWVGQAIFIALFAGFPVSLVLAWAFELTPEGLKPTPAAPDELAPEPPASRGRWNAFIIAGLVLALGYSVWQQNGNSGEAQGTGQDGTPATLAVLPFANVSSDPEQDYFADGITEELINSLAKIQGLQVTGRTSSFYFKGKEVELSKIGEMLGVEHIMEGSVRKSDNRLRITAQLIDVSTGYHLWSQTYERALDDVFSIQDDIAQAVAEALEVTLGVGEKGRLAGMTRNVAAYDEYLLAEARFELTAEGMRTRIGHLEKAVALDESFARAWRELGRAYQFMAALIPEERAVWTNQALEATEKANELAPNSVSFLIGQAEDRIARGEWLAAASVFAGLIGSGADEFPPPGLSTAYGAFLVRVGRAADGLAYLEQARRAEPLESNVALFLSEAYASTGKIKAALAELERVLGLEAYPGEESAIRSYLREAGLWAALASGDEELARDWLARAIEGGSIGRRVHEVMQPLLGQPAAALGKIERLAADPGFQGRAPPGGSGPMGGPLRRFGAWPRAHSRHPGRGQRKHHRLGLLAPAAERNAQTARVQDRGARDGPGRLLAGTRLARLLPPGRGGEFPLSLAAGA
jgi:adenylate cyclase